MVQHDVGTNRFLALDVETANSDTSSICAIGMAAFDDGVVVQRWHELVDPLGPFDGINTSIHGITAEMVRGKPTFGQLAASLLAVLDDRVVVSHTRFDCTSIERACATLGIRSPRCTWLDSSTVARRVWPDCARAGYGLADLCRRIGHEFRHHDPLEDAMAAGTILVAAMADGGLSLADALTRAGQRMDPAQVKRAASPDGPLRGERLVFTGALSIPRRKAADIAAAAGGEVARSVSMATTILVVGDLSGEVSGKYERAEQLRALGAAIRIMHEAEFLDLMLPP